MNPISRRTFLAGSAAVALAACAGDDDSGSASLTTDLPGPATTGSPPPTTSPATTTTSTAPTTTTTPPYPGATDPFTLGVASGDPLADSVVLWTRLLPAGEVLPGEVDVRVEVARDEGFADIVSTVTATAAPSEGHSLHVIADGLDADAWYFYRFAVGPFTSPVGRARTTAADTSAPTQFVLGSASCQNYEDAFYAAHADIAVAGLDVLVWLGDYIYEGAGQPVTGGQGSVRTHGTPEPTTVDDYRARYALYKSDPDLQAAHAACPWLVIWDDHEVENNYAGETSQDAVPADEFRTRRAAAYRAWWEHMPVRLPAPDSPDYVIYRSFRHGSLVDISLLDTRQYRSDQACGDVTLSLDPPCPEWSEPDRTMLGTEQETWLFDRLGAASARWNVLGQQIILGNTTLNGAVLNYDQWDGYPVARDRVLQALVDAQVPNAVVLTGDIHLAGIGNLRAPNGELVGAEMVATSISSGGNVDPALTGVVQGIPDIVDAELAHRGWIKHTVTPERWQAEYRIVDDAAVPTSPVSVYGTYEVLDGIPGATKLA
jgi:alkaline phosphatase D